MCDVHIVLLHVLQYNYVESITYEFFQDSEAVRHTMLVLEITLRMV